MSAWGTVVLCRDSEEGELNQEQLIMEDRNDAIPG